MNHTNNLALHRNTSGNSNKRSNRKILPTTTYTRITSSSSSSNKFMFIEPAGPVRFFKYLYRTFLDFTMILPSSCKWLTIPSFSLSITPSAGRKITGTLFGNRRGHVSFAVQDDPRSAPVLVVELSTSTATLVKEMSSGLVRIALECEKSPSSTAAGHGDNKSPSSTAARGGTRRGKLFQEPAWTMYCNGRRSGYAVTRACSESDWHVLSTVQSVSAGAGVIPVIGGCGKSESEGELLYMRARFERVVGNRDSEAFYMMNPDGHGGPELSIFLLRL